MIKIPFLKKQKTEVPEKIFEAPAINAKDIIAPSSILIASDHLKLGNRFARSFLFFLIPGI